MRLPRSRKFLIGTLVVALFATTTVSSAEAARWPFKAKKWLAVALLISPVIPLAGIVGALAWGIYNAPEIGADINTGVTKAAGATASGARKIGGGFRNLFRRNKTVELAPETVEQPYVFQNPNTVYNTPTNLGTGAGAVIDRRTGNVVQNPNDFVVTRPEYLAPQQTH